MASLQNQSGRAGSGMVKITPVFPLYLSDSVDGLPCLDGTEDDELGHNGEASSGTRPGSQLPAFSGAYTSAQVRDVFEAEMEHDNCSDRDGASTIFEEIEDISVGEVMKSPVFSEDESSDNSLWIDLGQSPLGSDCNGKSNAQKGSSPLPPFWFTGRRNQRPSHKASAKIVSSPRYDEEITGPHECHRVLSFDAAVLSASQDVDHVKEDPEETQFSEKNPIALNGGKGPEDGGYNVDDPTSVSYNRSLDNGSTSEICPDNKDSAIRRETEGEFRLLGRREGSRFTGGRLFGVEEIEQPESRERRVSFSTEDNHNTHIHHSLEPGVSGTGLDEDNDDYSSDGEYDDAQGSDRREPEIVCKHIDHVNMLGLNKTTLRLRFLINWLVTSLLQLRLPGSDHEHTAAPLVHIYGPKIKYERGAAVAFNVRDRKRGLVNPEVVQKLAEANGISLGIGILSHIRILDHSRHQNRALNLEDTTLCRPMENGKREGRRGGFVRVEVVTASLSFLTNFEDVYKLWAFVAKFLNPTYIREGGVLPTLVEGSET